MFFTNFKFMGIFDFGIYDKQFKAELPEISAARKLLLGEIAAAISARINHEHSPVKLLFICTHNSRRSQLAQAWAFVMIQHYFPGLIEAYSGGTSVTACHPNTIITLQNLGFNLTSRDNSAENPKQTLAFNGQTISLYSKQYDTSENPQKDFIALMTCGEASQDCPIVFGASSRFNLNYSDPKAFDFTPKALMAYRKTALKIGRELHYLFGLIKVV